MHLKTNGNHDHFQGQTPQDHIRTKREEIAAEVHGEEVTDSVSASLDAAREVAIVLMLVGTILSQLSVSFTHIFICLLVLIVGLFVWKLARSAWMAWSRLERLHRLVEEESFEIEHHRSQEREELATLYASKGLSGKLLKDVVDVLMADDERLLRVMLEEELGLKLEIYDHPIKQAIGAGIGVIFAGAIAVIGLFVIPQFGVAVAAFLTMAFTGSLMSKLQKNALLPALIWNIAIGALVFAIVYFLMHWLLYLVLL